MAKLNQPLCATAYGNVGFGDCFLEPSKIIGAIQVPKSFEVQSADLGTLQSTLEAAIAAAVGTRIFPYHNFISVNDSTEDVSITTTDYGAKYINRDGFYDFAFRYLKGGVQLQQEIAKNSGTGKYFLFYDDNAVIYGYKTSQGSLKGIPTDVFYANPWKFATGADAASYLLRFIINPIYMNKGNLGFYKAEFNVFDIVGLEEVSLTLNTLVANVANVSVLSKISGVNLYTAYSTQLAAAARWVATKRSDGLAIAITSVAADGTDAFIFTFNSGTVSGMDATDAIILKGAAASDWNGASIVGFEAHDGLIIELPGS